jgi:hypothetical protein
MANKPVRISGHARFEMKRRHIRADEVTAVVRRPGQVLPSVKGREIYQSLVGRNRQMLLRVVVAEDSHAYHVITAYKTSNIAKYWRKP